MISSFIVMLCNHYTSLLQGWQTALTSQDRFAKNFNVVKAKRIVVYYHLTEQFVVTVISELVFAIHTGSNFGGATGYPD
jgi:hypothetical protein